MSGSPGLHIGLIGDHIGQSRFSAAMEILCASHEMTLDFTSIDTGDLADFDFDAKIDELIAEGWTGVTVTHPYKLAARRRAGEGMQEDVSHLAASNLLKFSNEIEGFNTDYSGFLGAWQARMGRRSPGRVAVAGAGGVAGAIVPALAALGAQDIAVWDPIEGLAEQLAERVGAPVRAVPVGAAEGVARAADGVVNATAIGMGEDARSAIPLEALGSQTWAFDAVYTPTATPFLVAAKRAGLEIISGFDLFRHMVLGSFAAYTGRTPNRAELLPLIDRLRPV